MPSVPKAVAPLVPGLFLVSIVSGISTAIANLPSIAALRISPLIVGILLGVVIGNVGRDYLNERIDEGVTFAGKKILRLAIIFYGFRITFDQIASVGLSGVLLDCIMVVSTLGLGAFLGTKVFGLDRETTLLTSAGAAICGAAAVIATEPVVKAEPHQTAAAVATVVLFGTLSMFLYPIVYRAGVVPMPEDIFGIYIGASVHEVAHVVGAADAVGTEAADIAVIVKMTRVMLLAPTLMVIGWVISRKSRSAGQDKTPIVIPWFAVWFVGVAAFNSLGLIAPVYVHLINIIDTFLLTMAMTALGFNTVVARFKGVGLKPLYVAGALFLWLVAGGFTLTQVFVGS